MAEGNDDASSSWGSSWGSWISSAKSRSSSVLEAVRKDLDELSTVVRTEVSNAGSVIGETFKMDEPTVGNVKKSLSTFFGQVSEALIPSIEEDESDAVLITNDGQVTLVGFQKHLAELQAAEETYLTAPADSLTENYKRWLEVTEQDQFTQHRLVKHLTSSEILNEKYLSMVPDQVSHMDFWQRYLFRRALLEDALANAELAERRAQNEANSLKPSSPVKAAKDSILTEQPKKVLGDDELGEDTANSDLIETAVAATDDQEAAELASAFGNAGHVLRKQEDQGWETEDFASVEISEEEQARLLQEYDEEIQEREKRKSLCVPLEEKLRLEKLNEEPSTPKTNEVTRSKKSPPKPVAQKTASKPTPTKTSTSTDSKKSNPTNTAKVPVERTRPQKTNAKTPVQPAKPTKDVSASKEEQADDAANSDESWEKDFDLSDTK